jgi:hypothetical protein
MAGCLVGDRSEQRGLLGRATTDASPPSPPQSPHSATTRGSDDRGARVSFRAEPTVAHAPPLRLEADDGASLDEDSSRPGGGGTPRKKLLSPRITAPLARGPGSRWHADDSFYGGSGAAWRSRKRARGPEAEPRPPSLSLAADTDELTAGQNRRRIGGTFTPLHDRCTDFAAAASEDAGSDDDLPERSLRHQSSLGKPSPVFSPVTRHEHSLAMMRNISPISIARGDTAVGRTEGSKAPLLNCMTEHAADTSTVPVCRQTCASEESAYKYCMLCSFLFSQMPGRTVVMRPNPSADPDCDHAFCKGCYEASAASRANPCPECTRLASADTSLQELATAEEASSSSVCRRPSHSHQAAEQTWTFEALGLSKFSTVFGAARLTAGALVSSLEQPTTVSSSSSCSSSSSSSSACSSAGGADNVVAFLHAELEIDLVECEMICEQVKLRLTAAAAATLPESEEQPGTPRG